MGSVSTVEFGGTDPAVDRTGSRACAKLSRIALKTLNFADASALEGVITKNTNHGAT